MFRKLWKLVISLLAAVVMIPHYTCADDRITCCMGGWNSLKNIKLCTAPCCPGYEEKIALPPGLEPIVYCERKQYRDYNLVDRPKKLFRW